MQNFYGNQMTGALPRQVLPNFTAGFSPAAQAANQVRAFNMVQSLAFAQNPFLSMTSQNNLLPPNPVSPYLGAARRGYPFLNPLMGAAGGLMGNNLMTSLPPKVEAASKNCLSSSPSSSSNSSGTPDNSNLPSNSLPSNVSSVAMQNMIQMYQQAAGRVFQNNLVPKQPSGVHGNNRSLTSNASLSSNTLLPGNTPFPSNGSFNSMMPVNPDSAPGKDSSKMH